MNYKIISVGKPKTKFIITGEQEYCARLKHYTNIEMVSVKDEKIISQSNISDITNKEAVRINSLLDDNAYHVVLDINGVCLSSKEFAEFINTRMSERYPKVIFIIGGPLGLSQTIKNKAKFLLSLSSMTFTHEMSRLILLEQLYRSLTILRGEKYHK